MPSIDGEIVRMKYDIAISLWIELEMDYTQEDIDKFNELYTGFANEYNQLSDDDRIELIDIAAMFKEMKLRLYKSRSFSSIK